MKFTHLHVHSHFSLLDGLPTIPKLVERAKNLNMESLALTDHGVLYGAVEFFKTAKKGGLKPIIGCELYVAPRKLTDKVSQLDKTPYHLIVWCQNQTGYQNLLKLISTAHLEGYYYKPRVDKELLRRHHEGLICSTACIQGEVAHPAAADNPEAAEKALKEYLQIFGPDHLYIELQHHPELPAYVNSNKHLIELAHRHQLPLVATNDVHYLAYEDAEAQDALLCIQTGRLMAETNRMSMKAGTTTDQFINLSLMSAEEMSQNFADHPDAIENTQKVAALCNLELDLGRFIFPAFPVPSGKTPHQHLTDLCQSGLTTKIEQSPEANHLATYQTRLKYELEIIEKTGFSSYILMVADYTNEARRRGILTNTRGSAAGSLVSYLIGITDVNPIKYGLIFERFLNPERISWPDVDLDIADTRRGELIDYVAQKYGADKVAQIITFGTIAAKNSLRDVGRVLGMPYGEVDAIAKMVPFGQTLSECLETNLDFKEQYQTDPQVKRLVDLALKIEGVARHASVHAAGVVISDKPIIEYVPVQRIKDESGVVTQFTMYDLEAIGLVKMDFLGLANLTIIEQALDIIEATRHQTIKLAEIPFDDAATYRLLSKGESSGVFQLESDGMKRYLKELKPTQIGDVIAMVALYRPGPLELIPDFIAGKHGKKQVTYLHPKLEPILKETYGIAVYQEQVLQIAMDLCGFTYGEADVLRKAIGKKIKELLLEQRTKWVKKAVENEIKKELAEKLFDFVEPFARYGFNKAHATSYGIIAYQTAYLKAHFPSQFMAAWLTSEQSRDIDKVAFALAEAERMGISVLPPDVNESFVNFGVVPNDEEKNENIRFGLAAIKNVGVGVAEMIVAERKKNGPYQSLTDFLRRLDGKVVNRKTMESLIFTGAFDQFADRNQLAVGLDSILKFATNHHQGTNGQIGLFGDDETSELAPLTLPNAEPTTKAQKLKWEKELLGIYLSDHPLAAMKQFIGQASTAITDLANKSVGHSVRVIGLITQAKQITTKSNQPMAFVQIEDTTGTTEVIIFPRLYAETKDLWANNRIILVDGKLNNKDGSLKVLADRVWDITESKSLEGIEPISTQKSEIKNQKGQYPASITTSDEIQEIKVESKNNPSSIPPGVAQWAEPPSSILHITVPKGAAASIMEELKHVFSLFPGETSVILHLPQNGAFTEIQISPKINPTAIALDQLKRLVGKDGVKI